MCNLSEGVERRGIAKGRAESMLRSLHLLMKNMHVTLDQAMEILEVPTNDRPRYIRLINEK